MKLDHCQRTSCTLLIEALQAELAAVKDDAFDAGVKIAKLQAELAAVQSSVLIGRLKELEAEFQRFYAALVDAVFDEDGWKERAKELVGENP